MLPLKWLDKRDRSGQRLFIEGPREQSGPVIER